MKGAKEEETKPQATMATIGGLLNVIDSFHGLPEENIREFLNAIESAAGVGGWQPAQKLAVTKLHMKHEAAHYLEANPDIRDEQDWAKFKEAVMLRFEPKEHVSHALQNLMETTQRANETVSEFATRLKLAGQKTFQPGTAAETATRTAVLQETLMAQFLRGLKRGLKRAVLSRAPKEFSEAITMATQEEQNAKLIDSSATVRSIQENHISSASNRGNIEKFRRGRETFQRNNFWPQGNREGYNARSKFDSRCGVNALRQEDSVSNSRAQLEVETDAFFNKPCSECNEFGHFMSRCPKVICRKCGERGHLARSCPTRLYRH